MILQTAQGGAFKIGSKLHEMYSQKIGRSLSETEVKQKYSEDLGKNLRTINEEINKSANRSSQKIVDDLATKSTSNDNAKVVDNKVQGNAKRAELEAKLNNSFSVRTQQTAKNEAIKLIHEAKKNEPVITSDLQSVAKQTNGEMVGLDYRFKSEESLTRKVYDRSNRVEKALIKQGKSPTEVSKIALDDTVSKINDALRYTVSFTKVNYYSSYKKTLAKLEQQGYKILETNNFWEKAGTKGDFGYRGINTTLVSPTGQKFELQFHTPESFKLKTATHPLYEEARMPSTSTKRVKELRQLQIEMANKIGVPQKKLQ